MSRHPWYRHAVPLALAVSLFIPAIAAGQGIPAGHVPLSSTLGDIAQLRAAYADAFNAKDAKALTAMYTADAISIGADGRQTVGARAIGKMFADSAPTWPHAVVSSDTVRVYGSTAIDVGTWTVHPKEGGDIVNRYLVVLRHGIHGWKLQNVAVVPVPK
jgi:uncharacterized protein (TIGR02246 family)